MESSEHKLNAFELDRAELVVTQQLLKVVINDLIQSTRDKREAREVIAEATDRLLADYRIDGFGPDKTEACREYMRHHATTLLSEVGH